MFIAFLLTSFAVSFVVASIVVLAFNKPIRRILDQVVPGELGHAWVRYLQFAIYVVGLAGGVRVWEAQQYLETTLTRERWLLELYQTVFGTLQSAAMLLLVFFVFSLIAVVIVRIFGAKEEKQAPK